MQNQPRRIGEYLRDWRRHRRVSQLDLAGDAEISARHLSFLETGRAQPSREMILRLSQQLEIPAREQNVLLLAGGYAPLFLKRPLNDPSLACAQQAITVILESHKPYPAFALDRYWQAVASNGALPQLFDHVCAELLVPPINVMRLSLHPRGLAARIANLAQWRSHLLHRLRRQIDLTGDIILIELQRELLAYPAPRDTLEPRQDQPVVPLQIHVGAELLSFLSTTMVFGTAADVTLSEVTLELFFPADAHTSAKVQAFTCQVIA